jgi:hypothetical protein
VTLKLYINLMELHSTLFNFALLMRSARDLYNKK